MKEWKTPEVVELDVKSTELWISGEGNDGPLSDAAEAIIGMPVGEYPGNVSGN